MKQLFDFLFIYDNGPIERTVKLAVTWENM